MKGLILWAHYDVFVLLCFGSGLLNLFSIYFPPSYIHFRVYVNSLSIPKLPFTILCCVLCVLLYVVDVEKEVTRTFWKELNFPPTPSLPV